MTLLLARRAILLAPLFLAACGEEAPPSYPKPSYDHLTPLRLNIGRVDIDDSWAPRGASRRVESLAPFTPREALRRMSEDRLIAVGSTGRAVFVIEDASIIRAPKHYEGTLAVRIDMADDSGTRLGQATARVVQVRPVGDDTPRAVRDDLYAFVRDLMTEMNVEVEYQVRRAMRDMLQTTVPGAAEPGPVEVQSLDKSADEAPGRSVAEPETMSPPERPLGTLPGATVAPQRSLPGAPTPLVPR